MADRVVRYTFTGSFGGLNAGLTTAGRNVAALGTKLTAIDKSGVKMRAGLTAIGSTAGKAGLVAATGLGVAIAAAANFDQAISNVAAATHETAGNMALLRKAALEAGAATKFSATEAASAIENLAKAGVSTADILDGGLAGALDLAAAGNLEVADAAEIAATALTQFKLQGEDVPHVADLLAAGAGKAQGEVSDLSMALKQSGLVASQMGVSIEETSGTLAAFASAGLIGSDAGTAFRTMLLRLANPTKESAELMQSLGLAAYDAQGNFVGIESLAGQLATAFQGQTQAQRDAALATLFGSDAIRAANVLYTQGASGIEDWTDKVNDQGYAAETAAVKMDNLKGDLEQLRGSLETALIGSGSGSQGVLRSITQDATGAVNAFNNLSPAVQGTATKLLAITAVTGGALWFGSKVIQGISNTREALDQLGFSSNRTAGRLARLAGKGAGILAVASATGALADEIGRIDPSKLDAALKALGRGETTDDVQQVVDNLADVTSKLNAIDLGEIVTLGGLAGDTSLDKAADNIDRMDVALAGLVESGQEAEAAELFGRISDLAEEAGVSAEDTAKRFDDYALSLRNASGESAGWGAFIADLGGHVLDVASSTQEGEKATSAFGVAARQAAEASKAEADALRSATDAMRDKTSATLAAFDAETGYRQALKDAQEQAADSNAGIKGSTDEILANRSALSGLAAAWNNQSAAVKNNEGRYKQARKAFLDTAEAMGVPTDAAKRLADQILEIPKSRVAKVGVDGAGEATSLVQELNRELAKVVSKTITVTANVVRGGLGAFGFDAGGFTGPGQRLQPAGIVHAGEVVLPQDVVRRDKSHLMSRYGFLPGMTGLAGFATGGLVGYADGGRVRPIDDRLEIAQLLLQIRDLQRSLHATSKKDRLTGIERRVAQLQLEAAERDLRRAKRAEEREAAQAAREKRQEVRRTRRDVRGTARDFDLDAGMSVEDVLDAFHRLGESVRGAGGDLPENFGELRRLAAGLAGSLATVTKKYDETTAALEDMRAEASDFAAGVGGIFNNDIFAKGGLANAMLQLQADTNDTAERDSLLQGLSALGLDSTSDAFREIASRADLQTLRDLDTEAEVQAFVETFNQRLASQQAAGQFAAQAAFGPAIDAMSASAEQQAALIAGLTAELERIQTQAALGVQWATYAGTASGAEKGVSQGLANQTKKNNSKARTR